MGMRIQHSEEGISETHEINVTPFIDVMLVLLVIFMVTAPLTTVDIPVNLPAATAKPKPPEDKPVFLTLQADLTIAVGEARVSKSRLADALNGATNGNRNAQIFLRADKTVNYDKLMDLLNALRAAGYLKVALVGLGSD
ncbi:TonB system transport protein ExbD [Sphingobium sp. H39-3-25]|uniref:TonB system transport protein ExbD n=1 Tax=Sphingobium arseniciresistens TaxID=3030834 RepID=UPI0023B95A4B|nr:TonB system transport protein ExbD [Sphingobium arseniciresistens]